MGSMIELVGLTKVFGRTRAVDDLTCSIEPGVVTGFLGPNGAGKTTTMRMILGLNHPTSGTATIDGKTYRELTDPLRHVGALLDAKQTHPNRSVRAHLRWIAATHRLPAARVANAIVAAAFSGLYAAPMVIAAVLVAQLGAPSLIGGRRGVAVAVAVGRRADTCEHAQHGTEAGPYLPFANAFTFIRAAAGEPLHGEVADLPVAGALGADERRVLLDSRPRPASPAR